MEERHLDEIARRLKRKLPSQLLDELPKSYEIIGDIILLNIPEALQDHKQMVAQTYLDVIGMGSVMEKSRVSGELREPCHRFLAGKGTVTTHKENGIRYKIDLSRLMFSSGNINERIRMSKIEDRGHVVDMFAGIGYFTLPIAKYVGSNVTSLEKNPISYRYLLENLRLNGVVDSVTPMNIDCREYEGPGAKRIIMGYVRDTHKYLDKAIDIAEEGCIIHYHQTLHHRGLQDALIEQISTAASRKGCEMEIIEVRTVKKYSPGVAHIVADLKVMF